MTYIPIKPFAQAWRDMAHIPRWVILRKNRQQNLAEHSYYVTLYADQVARLIGWQGNYGDLMRYALLHDIDETITGDIPGPAKRAAWDKTRAEERIKGVMTAKYGLDVIDVRSSATREVRAIVSVADALDEVCYLLEEKLSGNNWVHTVYNEAFDRLAYRWQYLPGDPDFVEEMWNKHVSDLYAEQIKPPVLLEDKL